MKNVSFGHAMSVAFFGLAALCKSWPLGACSVALIALLEARAAFDAWRQSKQDALDAKQVAALTRQVEQLSEAVAKVSYRMNQVGSIVGVAGE